MQNQGLNAAIAAAIGGLSVSTTHADTIITDVIPIGELLSVSNPTYSGSFSIASLLAANNVANGTIVSANVAVYGYSNPTTNQTTTTYTGGEYLYTYAAYNIEYSYYYSCGWGCYGTAYAYNGYALYRGYENLTTVTNTDTVQDQIALTAGVTGRASGAVGSNTGYAYAYNSEYTSTNGTFGYDTYYNDSETITTGYYGALTASTALAAADLQKLSSTNQLGYSVSEQTGATTLGEIVLTADVAPVPIPGTALLFGSGLGALAAAARRRRTIRR